MIKLDKNSSFFFSYFKWKKKKERKKFCITTNVDRAPERKWDRRRRGVFFATIDASSGKPRNGRFIISLEANTRSTVSQRDTRTSFGELLRYRPNAASGAIVSCILDDFGTWRVSRSPRSIQFHENLFNPLVNYVKYRKISWFLCLKSLSKISCFLSLLYYFFCIDSLNILNITKYVLFHMCYEKIKCF